MWRNHCFKENYLFADRCGYSRSCWKFPLSPSFDQVLKVFMSRMFENMMTTIHQGGGLGSPCQWLRGERNFVLLQSKSLDDILNVTKILMNGTIRHRQMKRWWPVEWMVLDWETLILGSNNVKSLRRNNGGSRLRWSLCFQFFIVVVFYWS